MQTQPLYLNGAWVTADESLPVINPARDEPFARVAVVGRARVAQALTDADAAGVGWRALAAKARADILLRAAALLQDRRSDVARTITLESGKPLAQSHAELDMSVDHLRWFAEEARRAYGRWIPPQADGKRNLVIKVPVGVVGAISPWNFPLMLAMRKVAPALAAGCPVILKPSEKTPLSALALASCLADAHIPPGVFQIVLGDAAEIGAEFLANPLCRKITFTGSTAVGQRLVRGAADTLTRLSLELGGQGALLVFDDARLDKAVAGAVAAKFRNSGQSCVAANRFYVQRGIAPAFIAAFTDKVRALRTGDGLIDGVDVGPLIDERGLAKARRHIEDAQARGAKLVHGGHRMPDQPGFFLQPTVLTDVPDQALCMTEETFAPVAPIAVFDTEAEALRRANATPFGLAAFAFTQDLDRALRMADGLEAGSVGINDGVATTSIAPFGGFKMSGWGRELGSEGLDAFLETKHVSFAGVD